LNVTWVTEVEVDVGLRVVRRLVIGAAIVGLGLPAASGFAASPLGPAPARGIHPGSEVNFGGVSCEVGAVMRQRATVYLAIPASCGGIDLGKVQDGCYAPVSPTGLPVSIEGAKHHGTLVYNSFTVMQREGVTRHNLCYYNDLALVRVDRRDRHLVSASIPGVGAPRGIFRRLPASGTSLKLGTASGTAGATHHRGWEVDATTVSSLSTWQAGAPVTAGSKLVGMLIVLPSGPIPMVPVMQSPAEIYNMARSIALLRKTPGFRHVHLVLG
jgi:hypothetical protein